MIKETFLHSEPNLQTADATHIICNLHHKALKIKVWYDQYSLKESSRVLALHIFNTTPKVAHWFFHHYCTMSPPEELYRILIFIWSEMALRQVSFLKAPPNDSKVLARLRTWHGEKDN